MKWIITFLAMVVITVACEKSPMINNGQVDASSGQVKGGNELVGTWKMFTYYADNGTGSGTWQPGNTVNDVITFGENGSFSATSESPLGNMGYDRYAGKGNGSVTLYNTRTGEADTYQYVLESSSQLLFYPHCRENCMRRYSR